MQSVRVSNAYLAPANIETEHMKTNINIDELVDAFRAETKERLDTEQAARDKRRQELREQELRCAEAFRQVWPKFVEVIKHLPGGRVLEEPSLGQVDVRGARFRLQVQSFINVYNVDRGFYVWERDGKLVYCLSYGSEGGFLLQHEIPHTEAENPADLLVILARYAGRVKAEEAAKQAAQNKTQEIA